MGLREACDHGLDLCSAPSAFKTAPGGPHLLSASLSRVTLLKGIHAGVVSLARRFVIALDHQSHCVAENGCWFHGFGDELLGGVPHVGDAFHAARLFRAV